MKKIIIIILILVAIVIGFVIYNGTTKEYQALNVTASITSGQVDQLLFVHADTIGSEEVDAFLRTGSFDEDELLRINGVRQSDYRDNRGELSAEGIVTVGVEFDSSEAGGFEEEIVYIGDGRTNSQFRFNRGVTVDKDSVGVITGFELNIDNPSEGVYWMLVDVQGDILLSRLEDVDFDPTGQRIFESGWENITGGTSYGGVMKLELIQFAFHPDN